MSSLSRFCPNQCHSLKHSPDDAITVRTRHRYARGAAAVAMLFVAGCGDDPLAPLLPDTARISLQARMDSLVSLGVPGMVLLMKDGARTVTLTAGTSNSATRTAMRENDRFRIGSLTKTYLSVLMLQLVNESRVKLDDPVSRWVPGAVSNASQVTIRELLNHTSGIFDYFNDERVLAPYLAGDFGFVWTPRQLIAIADGHGPGPAPGTVQAYSNSNYTLLGLVVEAVTGRALGDVLQSRLIIPLGLAHTTFAIDAAQDVSRAHGYLLTGGDPLDVTDLYPFYWGAGNIVSDAADVARFYDALLAGRLLPAGLLAAMKTPFAGNSSNYGLGLVRSSTPCGNAFGHDGATPGYRAEALVMPNGRVITAFANSLTFDDKVATDPAAEALWRRILMAAACG
jgi:D-alanyl-D-alanine carboxypeptidase